MGFTLTPAIIFPLNSGQIFRLKLGGGIGLYSFGTMSISLSKVPMFVL